jgi:hypothetical protein
MGRLNTCNVRRLACQSSLTIGGLDMVILLQVDHVKAERNVLAEVNNPYVVKLFYSFQVTHVIPLTLSEPPHSRFILFGSYSRTNRKSMLISWNCCAPLPRAICTNYTQEISHCLPRLEGQPMVGSVVDTSAEAVLQQGSYTDRPTAHLP